MKEINSLAELKNETLKAINAYLLLYKKGSESCRCALENLGSIAAEDVQNTILMKADVSSVRDIHGYYGIDSVPALLKFKDSEFINVTRGCMTSDYYESLINNKFYTTVSGGKTTQKRVVVYSTKSCHWCTRLKDYLKENNIKFENVDVEENPSKADEIKRRSGQMGVPQTDIGGHIVVGFDKAKINTLLEIK